MSELLPCPFCGGEVEPMANGWFLDHEDWCFLETKGRTIRSIPGFDEEGLQSWNTRAERTCKDAGTRFNVWVCSECKATLLLMFDDYGEPTYSVDGVADVPRFCPNCGAKVVEQ